MSYRQVPVFLSSAMNTTAMKEFRSAVVDCFNGKHGVFALLDLFNVEAAPSSLEPPPDSNVIMTNGLFLLIMGADRKKVRGEIVTARNKSNKFFCFFDQACWPEENIGQFINSMDIQRVTYTSFKDKTDLLAKLTDAMTMYAVRGMMQLAPPPTDDLMYAADSAERNHDYRRAERILKDILSDNPSDFSAHFRMGFLREHRLHQSKEALQEFNTCVQLQPQSIEAQFNRAVCMSHIADKRREAIEGYDHTEQLMKGRGGEEHEILLGKLALFRAETRISTDDAEHASLIMDDLHAAIDRLSTYSEHTEAQFWLRDIPDRFAQAKVFFERINRLDLSERITASLGVHSMSQVSMSISSSQSPADSTSVSDAPPSLAAENDPFTPPRQDAAKDEKLTKGAYGSSLFPFDHQGFRAL